MSEKYVPIIGIEVHAELKTKTKMFSRSLNNPDEEKPNSIIDPVNMAHPGTLPVINKKAIEHMVRIGLAVGGDIANFTEFDRKTISIQIFQKVIKFHNINIQSSRTVV